MKKGQRSNNDLQNTTQKTKDRATGTSTKTGGKLQESKSFLLHTWRRSWYSGYVSGDKSCKFMFFLAYLDSFCVV